MDEAINNGKMYINGECIGEVTNVKVKSYEPKIVEYEVTPICSLEDIEVGEIETEEEFKLRNDTNPFKEFKNAIKKIAAAANTLSISAQTLADSARQTTLAETLAEMNKTDSPAKHKKGKKLKCWDNKRFYQ